MGGAWRLWALRVRWLAASLVRGGTRAMLAVVAVALGIAATMVTLALAAGARREIEAANGQVGRNLLMIAPAEVLAPVTRGGGRYTSRRLDREDVRALATEVDGLAAVSPVLERQLRAELDGEDRVTGVRGVTPDYVALRRFALARGRPLDPRDERTAARVAVVGSYVAERLGAGAAIVGRSLRIAGVPFEVVGLLAEKGMSIDGQNEDDQILIPLETARRRLIGEEWLSRIVLQAETAEAMGAVEEEARALLRRRHQIGPGEAEDVRVVPMLRTSEIRRRSARFLRGLSSLFAAVTLGVGGVGVLAVSFLNVRDRRGEIGLRRAVGARRRDIAALFVSESALLGVAGGLAGLLIGTLAGTLLARTLGWRLVVEMRALALPFVLSLALGLIFGLVPAFAAARLTPIEALRDG